MTSARHMDYFLLLDTAQQREAIQRMAANRMGDYTIAAATGLAVEQVRRILGEPGERQGEVAS